MKTTIKSLWALYKNERKVLDELRGVPSTDVLLSKWADYALANDLSQVFKWVYGQLNTVYHTSPRLLKQACVYNRVEVVSFLVRQNPHLPTSEALTVAAARGHTDVVRILYSHNIVHSEGNVMNTSYAVAKAACEGRQIELLRQYIPFPMDLEEKHLTTLMRVCAGKNFTDGLTHLLQWGISSQQWERVVSDCLQPYGLQGDCMLLLINNIPEETSDFIVKRSVGDALQRVFTVQSITQLSTSHHSAILKALVSHLSFEEFCDRNRSLNLVRNNHQALQEIWSSVQRDTILKHLPDGHDNSIKRKM